MPSDIQSDSLPAIILGLHDCATTNTNSYQFVTECKDAS